MFVRNWMSAPAVVVPPVVPAAAALGLMEKRRIRRLAVVRDARLIGIVTRGDLVGTIGHGRKIALNPELTVGDVMTRDPVVVQRDDTIETAAQLMLREKVSGLPVLDGEQVVGMITESDLFRAMCNVMGLGEPGARVVLSVPDGDDLIAALERRSVGMDVRSLVTFRDARRGMWDVVMRVRGKAASGGGRRKGRPSRSAV
jgi:acetoin utilization protein AcuB